jgi:hypothetical protein
LRGQVAYLQLPSRGPAVSQPYASLAPCLVHLAEGEHRLLHCSAW